MGREGINQNLLKYEATLTGKDHMQYNIHNEKFKFSDIGGIHREQYREYKDKMLYKNDVNHELTEKNTYFELTENGKNWFAHVKQAKESTSLITGKAVRKDAVVLCSTVESVPQSWDEESCKEYFLDKAKWYDSYLQEKAGVDSGCMLSVCVHFDESTPHATYAWLPMKDGKLQARNILTRDFLKALQSDSQTFTFEWIERYEQQHSLHLEHLEPIMSGSQRQHLAEAEYKKEQIRTQVEELRQEHEEVRQKLNQVNKEIVEKTMAPDLQSYETVVQENHVLKEELSLKDRVIEALQKEKAVLQETVKHLSETVQEWKEKFDLLAHKAGQRLMASFGFDVSKDATVSEYPSAKVKEVLSDMKQEVERYDQTSLRVVPDMEAIGQYRIVARKPSGEYESVERGFQTREEAEKYRREYKILKSGLDENEQQNIKMKIK